MSDNPTTPGSFDRLTVLPTLDVPVPDEVVALLRTPIGVTALAEMIKPLKAAYGDGLVIRYDLPLGNWLAIARPTEIEAA